MSDYIIEAKDIRKTYNSGSVTTDAIKGINFHNNSVNQELYNHSNDFLINRKTFPEN